ncbi:unnamed protein product [Dracunculus medinensis]|uniref:FERM domain-containing protein n=1 Tax=Dracunculus medinensis TaxID=318479 RepID=A0A0N4U3X2_DRAME|nr:unnamed protein product [Dracunculus medinensis]
MTQRNCTLDIDDMINCVDDMPNVMDNYENLLRDTNILRFMRLKSVEKLVEYPVLDFCFLTSQLPLNLEKINTVQHHANYQSGFYELLQIANQISAPANRNLSEDERDQTKGYFVLTYKTFEDMATEKFEKNWKTWTGARFICSLLPQPYHYKRVSFFKQCLPTSVEFKYVLVIQIENLMRSREVALNLTNYFKQRLCAYIALYREIDTLFSGECGNKLGNNLHKPLSPVHLNLPFLKNQQTYSEKPNGWFTLKQKYFIII